ncbi:MAG: hypothetical protein AABX70_03955 [Nanoarchaeota archaeon]
MKLTPYQERHTQFFDAETIPGLEENPLEHFYRERQEHFDALHERDGIVNLSLEEKLERAQPKLRGIPFQGLHFANPLLIASSPLTQSYETIQQYLDQGAAGVVLKSAGDFAVQCHCTRDQPNSGCERRLAIPVKGFWGHMVFSTSQASRHCERINFKEARTLYDKIKTHYPQAIVIASFGPETEEDFEKLDQLPGDAIEITPRYFRKEFEKPVAVDWWASEPGDASNPPQEDLTPNREAYLVHQRNIFNILKRQLPQIQRPTLYKWVGHYELEYPAMIKQEKLPANGFTIADSMKQSSYTGTHGFASLQMGKGSWSGERLFLDMLSQVHSYRANDGRNFVSASGGIFGPNSTLTTMLYGADTVQLCSALYHGGPKVIGNILKRLGL